MMGDPDLLDEDSWRAYMDPNGLLTDTEWELIKKSNAARNVALQSEPEPPVITDEEFLHVLFGTEEYGPRLKALGWNQGWELAEIIKEARENMADFLALPDARELFGLPIRKP